MKNEKFYWFDDQEGLTSVYNALKKQALLGNFTSSDALRGYAEVLKRRGEAKPAYTKALCQMSDKLELVACKIRRLKELGLIQ